jgi:hypothetical protein
MGWETVAPDAELWSAEYRIPSMKCRCTAVRLADGGFLVYSPGSGLEQAFADACGEASVLLAPNSYHHLGLPAWQQRFPGAVTAAAVGAHKRLARQGRGGLSDLEAFRGKLPPGVALLEPPGTRIGEVWLRVETRRGLVWVTGDCFFNYTRVPRRLGQRLLQRTLKSGPGLSLSQLMKWGGLSSRKRFKRWLLEQLDSAPPAVLVPVHGAIHDAPDLVQTLRDLIHRRL